MSWETLKARLRRGGPGSSSPFVLPAVVLEIQPNFVAGASLDGSSRQIRRLGVRELESGCLEPFPNRPNMTDAGQVRRAVSEVAAVVGNRGGRLGLLLPDAAVRVGTLQFETLPDDRKEAEALVRWRMREILPFAPEEARVCYQVLGRESGSVELFSVAIRGSVLGEYEAALESVNGGPALTLPATIALLPLLPEGVEGSQLVVHVCSGSVTSVVVAGDRVCFWRNRLVGRAAGEELAREVTREVARVLATCRDHRKTEIAHVWLCARPPATPELGAEVARALATEVHPLAGTAGYAQTLPPPEQALFERFGTTFAGLLANVR